MANMFDENGNYNKTEWKPGDRIAAGKLNKIEDALEAINNNDIERHKEADERLDALEEQNEAVEERFDELEDLVADNKSEVDTAIYEVHSKMDRLEQEMNDGIDTVEAIAHTVDDKIAAADASMKAQVAEAKDIVDQGKADMETMVAEVEEELEEHDTLIKGRMNVISVDELGAKGDGVTDDSSAIQSADNLVRNGGKVIFGNKTYKISSTVYKSQYTTWEGVNNNNFATIDYVTDGTKILSGFDGPLVSITNTADTPSYGGRGYIKNMAFWNDYNKYPTAIAIKQSGDRIKGLCYENLDIKNFCYGIWHENTSFCEFNKIYIVAKYALRLDAISDSEFIRVEVGNNIPSKDRTQYTSLYDFLKGGYGIKCTGVNPVTNGGNRFIDCRFQLASDTYYCALFENMRCLQFVNTIVDENEAIGILFKNSEYVDMINTSGWNNGKETGGQFTLQLEGCKNFNIIGGNIFNRDIGHINDYQGKGILVNEKCSNINLVSIQLDVSLLEQISGLTYANPCFMSMFSHNATLANGWVNHSDTNPLRVVKNGDYFRLVGVIKSGTITAGTVIGTLPTWCVRPYTCYANIYVDSQTKPNIISIKPNGNIEIVQTLERNSYVSFSVVY